MSPLEEAVTFHDSFMRKNHETISNPVFFKLMVKAWSRFTHHHVGIYPNDKVKYVSYRTIPYMVLKERWHNGMESYQQLGYTISLDITIGDREEIFDIRWKVLADYIWLWKRPERWNERYPPSNKNVIEDDKFSLDSYTQLFIS